MRTTGRPANSGPNSGPNPGPNPGAGTLGESPSQNPTNTPYAGPPTYHCLGAGCARTNNIKDELRCPECYTRHYKCLSQNCPRINTTAQMICPGCRTEHYRCVGFRCGEINTRARLTCLCGEEHLRCECGRFNRLGGELTGYCAEWCGRIVPLYPIALGG